MIMLPYIKDLSETLRRMFEGYGISVCFKPTSSIRSMLVAPKDKPKKEEIVGPIYKISCEGGENGCSETYVGETERSLKD